MAVINILSPHVADMIAAGEVVERPGSIIKELLENSVDAGAKNVTVELRGGGATYIRVTDDGCGMAPDDAGNCFLRHATSKLHDEEGLEAISTMGFRGEALAAISAVSRIELVTRREEDEGGTRIEVEAGEIQRVKTVGCPKGTTFTVRDIFYNTPARLKFMKSDRAEAAFCVQTALREALGHPDISVRCIRDGKEEFFTPGDGKTESVVYALLGREAALAMLPVAYTGDGISVSGYVSSPAGGRGNRAMQYFFVNGRTIRSQSLQAAVEQAYKNTLLVGRFPACVLQIELSPGAVDVNVHPTKSEVKFSSEKKVFDAVYYGTLNAVSGEKPSLEVSLSRGTEKKLEPVRPAPAQYASKPAAAESAKHEEPAPAGEQMRMELHTPAVSYQTASRTENYVPLTERKSVFPPKDDIRPEPKNNGSFAPPAGTAPAVSAPRRTDSALPPSAAAVYRPAVASPSERIPVPQRAPASPAPQQQPVRHEPQQTVPAPEEPRTAPRMVGEVMKTYIVVDCGDKMLLIDKHAAHERMNFDRLKAAGREIMSQALLAPEIWRPSAEDAELLQEKAEKIAAMGFELEPYGEEDIIVRAVPDTMDPGQTVPALEEICGHLRRGGDIAEDHILATIACKAAIKAGWDTDPAELQVLVDKVVSGEIRYCPHGRPVAVTLTRKELDKEFKRIV